jgi:ABC-type Fe3+ transport system permease subunit
MTYRQKMRRVMLPQALRVVIPPTGNEFIAMMKDTALVSVLGQSIESMELFRRAQLLGNADVRPTEALVTAAALYWALTAVFTFFQSRLERRVSRGYVRTVAGGPKDRERGKVIVTGAGGNDQGRASGSVPDAPEEALELGGHAHGAALPTVPQKPPEDPS